MTTIKLVVVGDVGVGKTSLLITYSTNIFPSEYVPMSFDDDPRQSVTISGETYYLQLLDTVGQDDYYQLRAIAYPCTSVFLVCFSVAHPPSFENVQGQWVPEIRHHCPNTPFLLVGTQVDLRDDIATLDKLEEKQEKPVSKEEGEILAKSLKAVAYIECSSLTREGVKNVFDQAISHHLESVKKSGCFKKAGLIKKGCFVL